MFITVLLFIKKSPVIALKIIGTVALTILLIWILITGFNWFIASLKNPPIIEIIIMIIFMVIFYGLIIMVILKAVQVWVQDILRWRKWFKMKKELLTYQEFFEATSFHSLVKRISAIREIRVEGLLKATAETELFLRTLEFEMELKQRRTRGKHLDESSVIAISSLEKLEMKYISGYNQFFGYNRYFRPVGPEDLDEVHKLLEDIHNKRENAS